MSDILALLFDKIAHSLGQIKDNDIAVTRAVLDQVHQVGSEPTDVTYEDVESAGGQPAVWATPIKDSSASSKVILYTHGGGFVTGSTNSHRKLGGHLAKHVGARVLLLDYRLAPEHQFPAGLEDTVAAYKWLQKQGYRPSQIAFAGDSAGGNLATAAALKIIKDGDHPPAAVVGFSPWYDMLAEGPTMEKNSATDRLVQKHLLQGMAAGFLGDQDHKDPLANPLYADVPSKMPPMFLAAGTHETLEGDVDVFADKLKKAGVEVEVEKADGMQHVYVYMAGRHKSADQTLAKVGKWLKSKL